ncbi:DNA alkylation repair protein [Vallicoccus soli]|uniref:DNA alkylation repair protein n=1 Tax=Vallicoccus soli TaxID=2339232 RepID=UPI001C498712|nr:DNA alkylation repair protein [Vallicoccus soli]
MDRAPGAGAPTAQELVAALRERCSPAEVALIRKRLGPGDDTCGIRMRDLFETARSHAAMPLAEVERLFASDLYEVRMGALCILDVRARARRATEAERARLYGLYLGHHDRITTWDMVDRAAPSVVGGHLLRRSRAPLHELAAAADPLRRRTAVTAPLWFVRYGDRSDLADVLALAAALADDPDPLVHLAVGTLLKHAGGLDPDAVTAFLDAHAARMPRPALRAATAKLLPAQRARFTGR